MAISSVVHISREYGDLAGAGGLKDVVHAIAGELSSMDIATTVIIPRYSFVPEGTEVAVVPVHYGGSSSEALIREMRDGMVRIITVETSGFLAKKDIYTYTAADAPSPDLTGKGHEDVNLLNSVFQEAAVRYLLTLGNPPDVIHCHDAHTGMVGAFMNRFSMSFFRYTGLLTTIHNGGYAYQQIPGSLDETTTASGLNAELLAPGVLNGSVNPFLLAGTYGLLNTVSPGYAKELLSGVDEYSGGLGAELSVRKIPLPGIINGLDADLWIEKSRTLPGGRRLNPESDPKPIITEMLARQAVPGVTCIGGVPTPDVPWVLFHGRLAFQKGIDEVLSLATESDSEFSSGLTCCVIVYGQGDTELEAAAAEIAETEKGMHFLKGYNPQLTAPLVAASSFVLVPSRWEPCGQIDMIGQILAALPIVRNVGGLMKINNNVDGFSYKSSESRGLEKKLALALKTEQKSPEKVRLMRQQAENTIYERRSWRKILVRGYLPLYEKARIRSATHSRA